MTLMIGPQNVNDDDTSNYDDIIAQQQLQKQVSTRL